LNSVPKEMLVGDVEEDENFKQAVMESVEFHEEEKFKEKIVDNFFY